MSNALVIESGDSVWWREGECIAHGFVSGVEGDYLSITDVRVQRKGRHGQYDNTDRMLLRRYVYPLHLKTELLQGACE